MEQETKPEQKIHCPYDKLEKLSKLKPHPKNRNKHPEIQIARLAKILEYQGVRYPIKVSKLSGFITSGHGRLLAAKHLGWKEMPVSYQDYDDEEMEYADIQADNAIALWAELDFSGINSDLADLGPEFDIDLLGIKGFMLDPDFEPASEDDQGQLDQKELIFLECPHCEKQFEKGQARVIKN